MGFISWSWTLTPWMQSSLRGLRLSSDLRDFRIDLGMMTWWLLLKTTSGSWSSSSSELTGAVIGLFLRMDLIPSEPEVRSSRLPWPLELAPLFFRIDEMAPAILWSGLAFPKLNFRLRIPCTGGSGEDLNLINLIEYLLIVKLIIMTWYYKSTHCNMKWKDYLKA